MSKPSLRSVLMALLLLSAAANAYAWPQRLSGDIEGVVKDATGALIPSVSITVTNVETSAERTLISDEYGHFLAALRQVRIFLESQSWKVGRSRWIRHCQ